MATRVGVVEFENLGSMIGCVNPTQLTERAGQSGRSSRPFTLLYNTSLVRWATIQALEYVSLIWADSKRSLSP